MTVARTITGFGGKLRGLCSSLSTLTRFSLATAFFSDVMFAATGRGIWVSAAIALLCVGATLLALCAAYDVHDAIRGVKRAAAVARLPLYVLCLTLAAIAIGFHMPGKILSVLGAGVFATAALTALGIVALGFAPERHANLFAAVAPKRALRPAVARRAPAERRAALKPMLAQVRVPVLRAAERMRAMGLQMASPKAR